MHSVNSLFIHLSFKCLSICFLHSSICASIHPFIHLSITPFIHSFIQQTFTEHVLCAGHSVWSNAVLGGKGMLSVDDLATFFLRLGVSKGESRG